MNRRNFIKTGLIFVPSVVSGQIYAPVYALPPVVTSGLLARWTLDSTSGSTAFDSSGNGKDGTLVNAPAWGPGQFGNGLTFVAASSQKVTCGDIGLSSLTAASISCWVKRTASGSRVRLGSDATATNRFIILYETDGNIYVAASNGANSYGTCASSGTSWHHLVAVFDGTQSTNATRLIIYLDSIAQTLTFPGSSIPSSFAAGQTPFELGHNTSDVTYSDGSIDDVRVYNRAITAGEVALLFANP